MARFLLTDTNGKKSLSFTMSVVAFTVVMFWLVLSIFTKVGHFEIRPFSGSDAMAVLGPVLSLYFGRRYTDGKTVIEKQEESSK